MTSSKELFKRDCELISQTCHKEELCCQSQGQRLQTHERDVNLLIYRIMIYSLIQYVDIGIFPFSSVHLDEVQDHL